MSGATGVLAGAAIAGAATSAYGISQQSKAAKSAADAAAKSKIDIGALDTQTRAIARQNALDSAALEKQLTPEVPQLRTAANQAVLGGLGGNAAQAYGANFLQSRFGQPLTGQYNPTAINTPLLNEALAKARSDLALGGQLSLDQRNEATRHGAAAAGTFGGGHGLGLGRDLAARDLGLTSYGVEQQRFANAAGLAPQELNAQGMLQQQQNSIFNNNLSGSQANAGNYLNQFGMLNSYYNNLRSQDLAAAQYSQSIMPPVVGLDPGSVANIAIGNSNNQTQAGLNAAGIRAQQGGNIAQLGGQLIGYGMMGGFGGAGGAAGGATSAGAIPGYAGGMSVMCWTAREVYGQDNPEWLDFRNWLVNKAPAAFREFYTKHGEEVAAMIRGNGPVKEMIRHLMDSAKTA